MMPISVWRRTLAFMLLTSMLTVVVAASSPQEDQQWVSLERDVPSHNPATSSWVRGVRPSPDLPMTLTVALRIDEDRRAELERTFVAVSDPASERYGAHLSMDEVTALLAVPEERVAAVAEYFKNAGAEEVLPAPNRDMLTVSLSVAAAETALRTTIHTFSHRDRPDLHILRASRSYALPDILAKDVDMVGDLLQFPRLQMPLKTNLTGSGTWPNACSAGGCKGLVTPAVLAQRYNLPSKDSAEEGSGNSMAVAEFQFQYFKDKDLSKFGKACHVDAVVDRVIGGNKPEAGIEAELDIEYIKAVAKSVPLTVVYNGDYSLLRWANQISSMSNPPYVHSVSYGNDEAQQTGANYMYTCNTAFLKAGVRGISILFASGDQGVCGREGCGFLKVRFKPDFPAASPYITAVGGTDFLGSSVGEETTWSGSGGGFSNTFEIPSYQQHAVAAYKSSPDAKLPPQAWWNNTGRGYPDVSALGGTKTPYCIASEGSFQGVAGTSASSPVVAGIFARLNGLRLAAGKSPMGFLNPFIYANPSAFQDVTTGKNGGGFRPKLGFNAVKGWDPATGWGTPDYEKLAKVVMEAVGSPKAKNDVSIVV
mmetsp:Transcript_114333/g.227519  ORF Transcript_114333/g.227519 Transcript_114333/m.227519 type:complete len:594 (-) Transcript_114333:152-1933(-)